MNREALLQLRRVVLNAPDEGFCMNTISARCGTVRCAWGWAKIDSWFVEWFPEECNENEWNVPFELDEEDSSNLFGNDLGGRWYRDSDEFLPEEKRRIRQDVSKLEVLANIDKLLRGERAKPYKCLED